MQSLNDEQLAAARSPLKRVHIVAGPGTGKTFTLVARICYLLERGISPHRIVVMTFTNNAANELKLRVMASLQPETNSEAHKLQVGTFHSICLRYLRKFGRSVQIANSSDLRMIISNLNTEGSSKEHLSQISAVKCGKLKPTNELRIIVCNYNQALQRAGLMDFDDLLLAFHDLLEKTPEVCEHVDAVLVDEFQDTSELQLQIALSLSKRCGELTVVGDPDQSIYAFRNARPENFASLRTSGSTAIQLVLNYRSTQGIIDSALATIRSCKRDQDSVSSLKSVSCRDCLPQFVKFQSTEEESLIVSESISNLIGSGILPRDIAVISRTSRYSRTLQVGLRSRGFSLRVLGGKGIEEKEIFTNLFDYLRTVVRDDDLLAMRRLLLNTCPTIGMATIEKIFEKQQSYKAMVNFTLGTNISSNQRRIMSNLIKSIDEGKLMYKKQISPAVILRHAAKYIDQCRPTPKSKLDSDAAEADSELISQAIRFFEQQEVEEATLDLADVVAQWSIGSQSCDSNQDCITVSTAHSAKGLEWPVVFLIGCSEEEYLPRAPDGALKSKVLDEERRLIYVALTRAKTCLFLSNACKGPNQLFPKANFKCFTGGFRFDLTCLSHTLPSDCPLLKSNASHGFQSANCQMFFRSTGAIGKGNTKVNAGRAGYNLTSLDADALNPWPKQPKPSGYVRKPAISMARGQRGLSSMLLQPFKPPSRKD